MFMSIMEEDVANQKHITYVRSAQKALNLVNTGEKQLALLVRPTKVRQVLDVSDSGQIMPSKINGLLSEVIHRNGYC